VNIVNKINRKLGKLSVLARAKVMNNGINAFWWTGKKNFGDLLTPELILTYGYTPIETPIETPTQSADIIGVGSLIDMLPQSYTGIILGSGLIRDTKTTLEHAKFAAVRGELTKRNLGLPNQIATGDLGLLANKLIKNNPVKKRYAVGLIPHFVDKSHPWISKIKERLGNSCCIINVQDSAHNVIKQAAQCDLILSSSLHGIIISDALNIKNVWIELSDMVIGSGFKFWDYNSAIDYEQPPLKVSSSTNMAEVEKFISNKNSQKIANKIIELDKILLSTLKTVRNK